MRFDLRRLSAIAAGLLVLVLAFAASATAATQEVTSPAPARAGVMPFIPGAMPSILPAPTTLARANKAIRSGQPPFKAGLASRQLATRLGILAGPAQTGTSPARQFGPTSSPPSEQTNAFLGYSYFDGGYAAVYDYFWYDGFGDANYAWIYYFYFYGYGYYGFGYHHWLYYGDWLYTGWYCCY